MLLEDCPTAGEFDALRWLQEVEPIGGMRGQQSHGLAFVEGQQNATNVSKKVDQLLQDCLVAFDHLESYKGVG